jgi:hypothetical protein
MAPAWQCIIANGSAVLWVYLCWFDGHYHNVNETQKQY